MMGGAERRLKKGGDVERNDRMPALYLLRGLPASWVHKRGKSLLHVPENACRKRRWMQVRSRGNPDAWLERPAGRHRNRCDGKGIL